MLFSGPFLEKTITMPWPSALPAVLVPPTRGVSGIPSFCAKRVISMTSSTCAGNATRRGEIS